jgi:type VI secretion system secreted protein Hcp
MDTIILSIASIKGNSSLAGFENKIIIESFSHGVSLPMNVDVGNSERTLGRPIFSLMALTKMSDVSTPPLYAACAAGTKLGEVTVEISRNQEGASMSLIKYTMANAMISAIHTNGTAGGAADSFSISFTKVTSVFTQQKSDASAKGNAQFGWDLTLNKAAA